MSPIQAVKTALSKYVTFSGRARRSEFWWFYLFLVIVTIIGLALDAAFFGTAETTTTATSANFTANAGPITGILTLATLLPYLAMSVRRLHDTDRRGWWVLLGLIPIIGTIILIVFYATDSKPDNRFGPSPKSASEAVTA